MVSTPRSAALIQARRGHRRESREPGDRSRYWIGKPNKSKIESEWGSKIERPVSIRRVRTS
eukprot:14469595-Alexandrium_andersonii.AAC.1